MAASKAAKWVVQRGNRWALRDARSVEPMAAPLVVKLAVSMGDPRDVERVVPSVGHWAALMAESWAASWVVEWVGR